MSLNDEKMKAVQSKMRPKLERVVAKSNSSFAQEGVIR